MVSKKIAIISPCNFHHKKYLIELMQCLDSEIEIYRYTSNKKIDINSNLFKKNMILYEKKMYKKEYKDRILKIKYEIKNLDEILILNWEKYDFVLVYGLPKLRENHIEKIGKNKIFNHHGAVLPFIRGLDSEYWSISKGNFFEVGVSLHKLNYKLDEGDIFETYTMKKIPILIWRIRWQKAKYHALLASNLIKQEKISLKKNNLENGIYKSTAPFLVRIISFFRCLVKI